MAGGCPKNPCDPGYMPGAGPPGAGGALGATGSGYMFPPINGCCKLLPAPMLTLLLDPNKMKRK